DRPFSGWSKYKNELSDRLSGWTLHDLRRTYRSIHGQTPAEIAHVSSITPRPSKQMARKSTTDGITSADAQCR
ncbi:MAG: hypothetical protein WAM74_16525, partial [Xanthobacteraceae bacterium]